MEAPPWEGETARKRRRREGFMRGRKAAEEVGAEMKVWGKEREEERDERGEKEG